MPGIPFPKDTGSMVKNLENPAWRNVSPTNDAAPDAQAPIAAEVFNKPTRSPSKMGVFDVVSQPTMRADIPVPILQPDWKGSLGVKKPVL